jgi:hypothetical protein
MTLLGIQDGIDARTEAGSTFGKALINPMRETIMTARTRQRATCNTNIQPFGFVRANTRP